MPHAAAAVARNSATAALLMAAAQQRAKEALSDDAVPPPAALAGLEQVAGLTALVDRLPEAAQQKALAWCSENEVHEVGLIAAAGIADAFVAALGIKPTGVPALLLRQRLKRD
ncbi:hypothetical protein EMIHUDRAFT_456018 [Emiliania huxleyi CCMP1516]|uniref:SAM domain-containing protein n=2 Tax=Emiliania huxleyi TaxID=2903 RepID=A0A0D3KA54_EMIH1|nr:hypothetical protein EMIHUDRAFT_456018 [Emiliania huxleyi CCMP1516]EOD32639.1 hypothetical protein EMIHUDRAFT_456018 [Emiliania huxleyi CCMP1516]|eukprot:XP_005785068.1 hypothetical protein EMIHUDRAFT_456018 [Emiliania huxleyi CCMP1516]